MTATAAKPVPNQCLLKAELEYTTVQRYYINGAAAMACAPVPSSAIVIAEQVNGDQSNSKDTEAAKRFLEWCQTASIGGRQAWPVLAWEYHQYLLATEHEAVSAGVLTRQLGALLAKGMMRVRKVDRKRFRDLNRLLYAQGWAVASCDQTSNPKVRFYDLPSVRSASEI